MMAYRQWAYQCFCWLFLIFAISACSHLGGDIGDAAPDVAQDCEELGVTIGCNANLYADQVSAMGEALLAMKGANQINDASYNVQAEIINQMTVAVNDYSVSGGSLENTSSQLRQMASFISTNGGAFKIIEGMRAILGLVTE